LWPFSISDNPLSPTKLLDNFVVAHLHHYVFSKEPGFRAPLGELVVNICNDNDFCKLLNHFSDYSKRPKSGFANLLMDRFVFLHLNHNSVPAPRKKVVKARCRFSVS